MSKKRQKKADQPSKENLAKIVAIFSDQKSRSWWNLIQMVILHIPCANSHNLQQRTTVNIARVDKLVKLLLKLTVASTRPQQKIKLWI